MDTNFLIWCVDGDHICIALSDGDPRNTLRLLRDSEVGRAIEARSFNALSPRTLQRVKDLLANLEDITQMEGAMLHIVRHKDGTHTIGDETYYMFSDFQHYRKIKPIKAVCMGQSFKVDTLEGTMEGKEGDYLIEGVHGELYPCDAAVFAESYKRIGRCSKSVEWAIVNSDGKTSFVCTRHLLRTVNDNTVAVLPCQAAHDLEGCEFTEDKLDG